LSTKASGGKSKASAGLKFVSPAKMIQMIVRITPTHRNFENFSMTVILR
jgi:hypothetical protein